MLFLKDLSVTDSPVSGRFFVRPASTELLRSFWTTELTWQGQLILFAMANHLLNLFGGLGDTTKQNRWTA